MTILSKLVHSTKLLSTRSLSTSLPISNAATVVSNTPVQSPTDAKGIFYYIVFQKKKNLFMLFL